MKRSSQNINNYKGFTLFELLITIAVMAVVLTGLCEVYFAVCQDWERQFGKGGAINATSQTIAKISENIMQSDDAAIVDRFTTGDVLALNLPADKAHGIYVPMPVLDKLKYRSGRWIVFYLSDSTGSYSKNGDTLWLGNVNAYGNVIPDINWSKYPNGLGKITPLSSIRFAIYTSGIRELISIEAKSSYTINKASNQSDIFKQSASVCVRNNGPQ